MAQPIRIQGRAFRHNGAEAATASIAGFQHTFSAIGVCRLQLTDAGKAFRQLRERLSVLGWATNRIKVYPGEGRGEGSNGVVECGSERKGRMLCDIGSRVRMDVEDVWAQLQTEPPPRGSRAISERLARLKPVWPAAAAEVGKSLSEGA